MSIYHKKCDPLIFSQLAIPSNCTQLLPRKKLEELVCLLTARIKPLNKQNASSEELHAFCYAKVVYICVKACRTNDFNKMESLIPHVVALKSLQGKSIYEAVFSNISEEQFHNLLAAFERNKELRRLVDKDAVYVKHRARLIKLESLLGISISDLKAKIAFYRFLLHSPEQRVVKPTWPNIFSQRFIHILNTHRFYFFEALILQGLSAKKDLQEDILAKAREDHQLKKLFGQEGKHLPPRSEDEQKACVLAIEGMGYSSKEKVALLVRVINEGWKRLIDDTKYKVTKKTLDSGRIEYSESITNSLIVIDIKTLQRNKQFAIFASEKKRIPEFETLNWQFKAVRIAGWCVDEKSDQVEIIKMFTEFAQSKNYYDVHIIVCQRHFHDQRQFLRWFALEVQKRFNIEVCIHVIGEDRANESNLVVSFHIDGELRLPALKQNCVKLSSERNPSLAEISSPEMGIFDEIEEFKYTCPSYFDRSKVISEDLWAVTLIGYTKLVIEGIEKGDRFRKIVDFQRNSVLQSVVAVAKRDGYNYQGITRNSRELTAAEEITFESKSETWIEKSKKLKVFLRNAGREGNTQPLPFVLFSRSNLITQKFEVFKIENQVLIRIYEGNQNLFFTLMHGALKHEVSLIENDYFNPFIGENFLDTRRIMDRLNDPSNDFASDLFFFGEAIVNDLAILVPNPARHLENNGAYDTDARNFRKEMAKIGKTVEFSAYYEARQLMLTMKKEAQLIELKKVPQQTMMTFVDEEDWLKLAKHTVLVHAIQPDRFFDIFSDEVDWTKVGPKYNCLFAIKKVLTRDGVIGANLEARSRQFKGSLNFRPHLHWSWDQLVQRHSVSHWEDARIAVLEPLIAFEDSEDGTPALGVAPYDTFTIGSHKLSKHSTLVVPDIIEEEVRSYLNNFQGNIISYKFNENIDQIRQEIFKALMRHYPKMWHVVDHQTGHKIGSESHMTPSGYSSVTCVEKTDGDRIILISGEGRLEPEARASAIRKAIRSGKYIGIHNNCVTYWLEDSNGVFRQNLTPFKENTTSIIGKNCFIGFADKENFDQLLVLKALEFRNKMHEFAVETKASEVGDYILKETIYADLMSLIYAENPDSSIIFTPYELFLMISVPEIQLRNIINNLFLAITSRKTPLIYMQKYVSFLRISLISMIKTKEMLSSVEEIKEENGLPNIDLLINKALAQDWTSISLALNAENTWPLSTSENCFFLRVGETFYDEYQIMQSAIKQIGRKIFETGDLDVKQKLLYLEQLLKMHVKEKCYNNQKKLMHNND